jgi:uncharacterized coiled-coil DUF342 family protein
MSVVEDIRKSIRSMSDQIVDIRKDLSNQREEIRAMEQRLFRGIDQGKDGQKTIELSNAAGH